LGKALIVSGHAVFKAEVPLVNVRGVVPLLVEQLR
jgi:hypothetical protein